MTIVVAVVVVVPSNGCPVGRQSAPVFGLSLRAADAATVASSLQCPRRPEEYGEKIVDCENPQSCCTSRPTDRC